MCDFIDIDAGKIIEGARADAVADEIFEFLFDVCYGKQYSSVSGN